MFLANGDVHECDFLNGRAHGEGTYVSAKGIEFKGKGGERRDQGQHSAPFRRFCGAPDPTATTHPKGNGTQIAALAPFR